MWGAPRSPARMWTALSWLNCDGLEYDGLRFPAGRRSRADPDLQASFVVGHVDARVEAVGGEPEAFAVGHDRFHYSDPNGPAVSAEFHDVCCCRLPGLASRQWSAGPLVTRATTS